MNLKLIIALPLVKFPILASDTIVLREIEPSDMQSIMSISFYDAKVATTIEEATEMHNRIVADYTNGETIHWGIADHSTNEIVGTLGYYRGFKNEVGELGCVLKPAFYGKGFMSKAMKLAFDFGKNELKLKRIAAITSQDNKKAIQLLERLNFRMTRKLEDNELEFEHDFQNTPL